MPLIILSESPSDAMQHSALLPRPARETLKKVLALFIYEVFCHLVQGSTSFCAPDLVKFVPAVARQFCLALSGSFLNVLCAELS